MVPSALACSSSPLRVPARSRAGVNRRSLLPERSHAAAAELFLQRRVQWVGGSGAWRAPRPRGTTAWWTVDSDTHCQRRSLLDQSRESQCSALGFAVQSPLLTPTAARFVSRARKQVMVAFTTWALPGGQYLAFFVVPLKMPRDQKKIKDRESRRNTGLRIGAAGVLEARFRASSPSNSMWRIRRGLLPTPVTAKAPAPRL
ncbi:BZ3500_MvSof-1268-A1-R1_Chr1-3g02156 [Microbotryum saponariae]|uniref:BZ3500_MvSof-1268-A1-R1_Chr1-3g02156 protein n=1 Tax=Microbotryum saponariae TaxID=289078 RepID=A0A2X0L4U7_9BASI|nr:BZ3500_MvSof-1268-A1-R1_Chr1-3g02156 [Microbotryum saponariae]SCZ95525.1 BZ3501_MvSof-1269-A2-R1_Chr1-3g01759 [Microbotryum saponariae]